MGKLQALRQPPPERQDLAAAIARHAAALAEVAKIAAARDHAEGDVLACHAALKRAEEELVDARAQQGPRLAAAALGEDAGLSVGDAEVGQVISADDLNVARAIRDGLAKRADAAANEVEKAERDLAGAIADVIKSEAPLAAMLAEAKAVQEKLIAHRIALRWLERKNCIGARELLEVQRFLRSTSLPSGGGGEEYENWNGHPAADPWRRAAEALRSDPAARLPE
jgi:hypothetical protein